MTNNGVANFRAPEVRSRSLYIDYAAADIYSLGIILFILHSGVYPYVEGKLLNGVNLFETLHLNPKKFWDVHNDLKSDFVHCDNELQELFHMMTKANIEDRATIQDIKESKWYKGKTFSKKDLATHLKKLKVRNILKKSSP
mmetsp:Transcript_4781/g.3977  ORF Transcript_4781/g.3977 Transcript_4781/m.3977 type:complete len:141 (+) Transcript_4781:657-1079(+)